MNKIELVIIVGSHCSVHRVNAAEAGKINDGLMEATKTGGRFCFLDQIVMRGTSVHGWYFREVKPSSTDAINKIADSIIKESGEDEPWKNG